MIPDPRSDFPRGTLLPPRTDSGHDIHCHPGPERPEGRILLLPGPSPACTFVHDGHFAFDARSGRHAATAHWTCCGSFTRLPHQAVPSVWGRSQLHPHAKLFGTVYHDPKNIAAKLRHGIPTQCGLREHHRVTRQWTSARFLEDERKWTKARLIRIITKPVYVNNCINITLRP